MDRHHADFSVQSVPVPFNVVSSKVWSVPIWPKRMTINGYLMTVRNKCDGCNHFHNTIYLCSMYFIPFRIQCALFQSNVFKYVHICAKWYIAIFIRQAKPIPRRSNTSLWINQCDKHTHTHCIDNLNIQPNSRHIIVAHSIWSSLYLSNRMFQLSYALMDTSNWFAPLDSQPTYLHSYVYIQTANYSANMSMDKHASPNISERNYACFAWW